MLISESKYDMMSGDSELSARNLFQKHDLPACNVYTKNIKKLIRNMTGIF
jgi:hypothetical protein